MTDKAQIQINDKSLECPVVKGTEGDLGIDISQLKAKMKCITFDEGFANTGVAQSSVSYIDGEKGILRYRGYPIEELAEKSRFVEVAWLLIWGELPTKEQLESFSNQLTEHAYLNTDLEHHFDGFPHSAHPMAILSAMINAVSCYYPELMDITNEDQLMLASAKIISKVRTIAAFSYRKNKGLPFNYPHPKLRYCSNFLHMMFTLPHCECTIDPVIEKALNMFLILHGDHGQNCSSSTARMVGSSKANLFGSVAAAVCALWGVLHGGANMAVIKMLEEIQETGKSLSHFIDLAKSKTSDFKLMGFGHRVYKNFDPRAKILKKEVDNLFNHLNIHDPLLDIAKELEEVALNDEYFKSRKLYPNVDFYSGILLRTLGIPVEMFTVMFAIGRIPGWIAQWKEVHDNGQRIYRPRQVYTGYTKREYVPMEKR